ncbi:uncharacterized protein AMSG_04617 [Thecamonas trahens ATCC 50062]|uniref:Inward rectifier potassium channel C-terminal domain-containing protein n=1 Tax=Thecamonas trahens ATCC 50062 TaxID=461836 RepID=A0A0L0D918_THETB|nr:hypothetical protein AMSG_04617 [Thecamonas trahens ATCC 50062]KNC48872.1 hypothetical protein AMSG_04617 [Thecamonas trahens ATCC 50062]|eukprot:XP_013758292.1 hypothetical protein AMSG_04617 [Thecamonas trahens ATCC 50062]
MLSPSSPLLQQHDAEEAWRRVTLVQAVNEGVPAAAVAGWRAAREALRAEDALVYVRRGGKRFSLAADGFYYAVSCPWAVFVAGVAVLYTALALVCVALQQLDGAGFDPPPRTMGHKILINLNVLTGLGLGKYSVSTTYMDIMLCAESLLKVMCFSFVTGLVFSRFARPRARICASSCAVLACHMGAPVVMLRIANERDDNRLINASFRCTFSISETGPDGSTWRHQLPLTLRRDFMPTFALPLTLMHDIDEHSPLARFTPAELLDGHAHISLSVSATDPTQGGNVSALFGLRASELEFGKAFADMFIRDAVDPSRRIVRMDLLSKLKTS